MSDRAKVLLAHLPTIYNEATSVTCDCDDGAASYPGLAAWAEHVAALIPSPPPAEGEPEYEYAVSYCREVGRNVSDGWVKFNSDETAAREAAARLLDGKVLRKPTGRWEGA